MKMRANPLPILVRAAIAWAVVACGCSSSGGNGPALPPFNPFGVETALPTGNEPTVSGADQAPRPSAQTIPELCAVDCMRIMEVCPGLVGSDCVSSCSTIPPDLAGCMAQIQAFLACVSTAALDCSGGSLAAPSCDSASIAITNCANAGAV